MPFLNLRNMVATSYDKNRGMLGTNQSDMVANIIPQKLSRVRY